MTRAELTELFRHMKPDIVLSSSPLVLATMERHNISISTIRRWRRQGLEKTEELIIRLCSTCGREFYNRNSRATTCGSKKCHKAHRYMMLKANRLSKPTQWRPDTYERDRDRRMQRQLTRNRATNSRQPYTNEEMEMVTNYQFTAVEIAYKLKRSVQAIESRRRYAKNR